MRREDSPAIVIAGPTASGKSALAMRLAGALDGEIVSCDALQIYRGMDIGTAKPSPEDRRAVPHHLLDLLEPGQTYSAGDYLRDARRAMEEIRSRGRLPIIAGGTGFYLRALTEGLFEGPGRSPELRKRLHRIVARRGSARLHRVLRRADPRSAEKIPPADRSRIVRAYEVFVLTGKPLSWWQEQPAGRLEGFRLLKLALSWPRPELYRRIEARVERMFEQGFVQEVEALLENHDIGCHAFKAIGYRQVADYLTGKIERNDAVEDTKRESRRYAKRQMTWFRKDPELMWLEADQDFERLVEISLRAVHEFREIGNSSPRSPSLR